MKVETKFKIEKLRDKSRNTINLYEKLRYFRMIEDVRNGRCPECHRLYENDKKEDVIKNYE